MIDRVSAPEAVDDAIRARLRDVWTMLPGRVVSFTAAGSTAVVQPFPADYVAGVIEPLPVLYDVRVVWPQGGGGSITWPLIAGDTVMLVFAARSLDRYRVDTAEGDPQSIRTQDLSDAIALPFGLSPDASALTTTANLVITRPTGAKVQIGGTGGSAVARGGDNVNMAAGLAFGWAAWAAAITTALNTLSGGVIIPPTTAPTVTASSTTVEAT